MYVPWQPIRYYFSHAGRIGYLTIWKRQKITGRRLHREACKSFVDNKEYRSIKKPSQLNHSYKSKSVDVLWQQLKQEDGAADVTIFHSSMKQP